MRADWIEEADPVMTCYKLVKVEFNKAFIGGKIERLATSYYHELFTLFHRQLFCLIDEWHGMTLDDIRRYEEDIKRTLDEQRDRPLTDEQRRAQLTSTAVIQERQERN